MIQNKKAFFDYSIQDTLLTGMVLQGWEVKSIRNGQANLKNAWVRLKNNELFLENFQINAYKFSADSVQKQTTVKLLATKKEIRIIERKINEKGYTLIPLRILNEGRYLKCEIGLGKGRKKYEKRSLLKERSQKKEIDRTLKNFNTRL